jgi:ferredoxin-NADP reductase
MPATVSLPLAALFVFLGAFNVWVMLTQRANGGPNACSWIRLHRIAGYFFVLTFIIATFFMLLRVKGNSDELAPRVILHMLLALLLAPLLFAKILVARRQKAQRNLLAVLGIAIFACAFALVTMNAAIHFLGKLSTDKLPRQQSMGFVAAATVLTAAWILRAERGALSRNPGIERANRITKAPDSMRLTLTRVWAQTHDAKTLRFLVPRDRPLTARPGQFLTFEWNVDGERLFRSYSICSSAREKEYVDISVKRVPHGRVSTFLNDRAAPGLAVNARGPFGEFCFDENKHSRIVLIGAGSGITPMMGILRYLDDLRIERDVSLIYCVRTEADIFFRDAWTELRDRVKGFRYQIVLSQPGPDWQGLRGHLSKEHLKNEIGHPGATYFLCGPPAFMEHAKALLTSLGVPTENILQESFGTANRATPPNVAVAAGATIEFVRSGTATSLLVGETVLEAAERNGIAMDFGCRQGQCGTCATRLLDGTVRMACEDGLTAEQRTEGFILPCVSRAVGKIRLDA